MAPKGRNVLIIVGDDIGAERLNGFVKGSSTASTVPAENIAKLRKAGVTFTSAWAYPTCSPTRAALLTGAWAHRIGILKPEDVKATLSLPSGIKLLPSAMPPDVVSGLFGKWHLSDTGSDPVTLGFERFVGFLGGGVTSYKKWKKYDSRTDAETEDFGAYTTAFFVNEALSWIKEQEHSRKRWFAMIAFNAPHGTGNPPNEAWIMDDLSKQCVILPKKDPGYTRVYELQIRCLDAEIGRLLGGLRAIRSKPLEETTIIFLGDNGTPGDVAEAPVDSTRAKGTVYQGGVHVPLIISDGRYLTKRPPPIPGNRPPAPQLGSVSHPGRSVGSPVHVVDLYPTIREILSGVGGMSAGNGVSLNVFLGGSSMPSVTRKAILTANCDTDCSCDGSGMAAATDGRWKLIKKCDTTTKKYSGYAFYDLETDEWETVDLFSKIGTASSTPALETAYSSLDSFLISVGY
jgi:arylsulfatase A-like enzyme